MDIHTYLADSDAPIINLSAKKHFQALTTNEAKLYAHHLSKASFWGSRVVLRSVSPESETIYDLILSIHHSLGEPGNNEEYLKAFDSDDQLVIFYLEYASQFLSNLGNYKSFGDKKFIPQLLKENFDTLIEKINNEKVSLYYNKVRNVMYSLDAATLLGWPQQGQVSAYYFGDVTKPQVEAVNEAIAEKGIMPENTRVEKVSDDEFVVHVACANTENNTDYYPKQPFTTKTGTKVSFKFGDHSREFKNIVHHLAEARKYVANDTQGKLLDYYIESFTTGSMNAHKNSQIEWVKDMKPQVESNIGFIETYRDPSGVRGEWEGLVAMINHDRTQKFSALVQNAGKFISQLPWDNFYEKDSFNPPDFTSLEVLTFAGSGIPAGINIPNYDDVRLNVGFKNVSLGNVLSSNPSNPKKEETISFVKDSEKQLFKDLREPAFEVQVGLHELLGHGSGKLLQQTGPNQFNFDPADSRALSYYKQHESWGSVFGVTAGSYEECRAELVALYLILKCGPQVLPIFGVDSEPQQSDLEFVATLLMCRAGLLALEFWDPNTKIWGQPHMRARFGIMKSMINAGVCNLTYSADNYDDLVVTINRDKLRTAAVQGLGEFLLNLHVYKATANVTDGAKYYDEITAVTPEFSRFRDVVLAKKLPRRQFIQANTCADTSSGANSTVSVVEYPECEAGLISSYYHRDT